MDYRSVYIGAETIFGVLFLVHFFLHQMNNKGQKWDKLAILYLLFLGTVVLDSIWVMIDGIPEYRTWHIILEVTYLIMMSLTGYDWFLFTLDFFPAKDSILRKYRYLLFIPTGIMIALIFISLKTGWIFYVDQNGVYVRGGLHLWPVILNYAYMVIGSYVALQCMKNALMAIDKRRYLLASLFPVPVLIFSAIQQIYPPGLPMAHGGVLVALLMQYGASQNALVTSDHLTGLPNRVAFEQALLTRIRKYRPEDSENLYLLEGDIDEFKSINDNYGHSVGDQALVKTADVLSRVLASYDSTVFRVGGDEFMIIVDTEEELDMDQVQKNINEKLLLTTAEGDIQMKMSLGVEKFDESMNMRTFIDSADQKLYKSKERARKLREKAASE